MQKHAFLKDFLPYIFMKAYQELKETILKVLENRQF